MPFGLALDPEQSPMDEVHPPVRLILQAIQDPCVKDEQRQHVALFLKRAQQAMIIRGPKVTSVPMDADAGKRAHRRRM
jgi:hypothetical protein